MFTIPHIVYALDTLVVKVLETQFYPSNKKKRNIYKDILVSIGLDSPNHV